MNRRFSPQELHEKAVLKDLAYGLAQWPDGWHTMSEIRNTVGFLKRFYPDLYEFFMDCLDLAKASINLAVARLRVESVIAMDACHEKSDLDLACEILKKMVAKTLKRLEKQEEDSDEEQSAAGPEK